jgi:hypothetical protein
MAMTGPTTSHGAQSATFLSKKRLLVKKLLGNLEVKAQFRQLQKSAGHLKKTPSV